MSGNLKVSTIGKGKQLVFLHGWGVNSGVWQPLINILQQHYCITCIDMPGYGMNQQNMPENYDLKNVAHIMAQHLPDNCTLVGWSLGGLLAQQIALDFPNKLSQLILICSSPRFAQYGQWPGINPKVLTTFMQQLDSNLNKTLDRFLAIQAMGSPCAKQDVKIIKQAVKAHPVPNKTALVAGLEMLNNIDLTEKLKNLSVPCHVFLGRLDTLVPASLKAELTLIAPQIKVEVLPKVSHAPFISETQKFAIHFKNALI